MIEIRLIVPIRHQRGIARCVLRDEILVDLPLRLQPPFCLIGLAARDPSLMTNGTNETDLDHENRPPVMTGSPTQTINISDTLTLTATATDDGRPTPLPDPGGRLQQGVRVRWIVYRGAGKVRFDPDIMSQRVYGKPATMQTQARFAVPGAYRLRAIASDGQTFSTYDVDVTVK